MVPVTNSLFMYYGEQSDADGLALHWPGGPSGLPFRGPPPGLIAEEEYEDLPIAGVVRVRIFYMDNKDDIKDYCDIRGKIFNGMYRLLDRTQRWDEDKKCERILLEYVELAHGVPKPTKQTAFTPMKETIDDKSNESFRRRFGTGTPPGMQLEPGWPG